MVLNIPGILCEAKPLENSGDGSATPAVIGKNFDWQVLVLWPALAPDGNDSLEKQIMQCQKGRKNDTPCC